MRKLNILEVIRGAYASLLDVRILTRGAGLWLGLLFAGDLVLRSIESDDTHTVVVILATALQYVVIAGCAVNVHRFILLHQPPALLRISKFEMRYVLRSLWIWAAVVLAVGAVVAGSVALGALGPLRYILMLAVFVIAGPLLMSFTLSLPAAAIGRAEFSARHGLGASTGNRFRLLAAFLLSLIPFAVAVGLDHLVTGTTAATPSNITIFTLATIAIRDALTMLQTVVTAALLSLCYAGLVEDNEKFAPRRAQPS